MTSKVGRPKIEKEYQVRARGVSATNEFWNLVDDEAGKMQMKTSAYMRHAVLEYIRLREKQLAIV